MPKLTCLPGRKRPVVLDRDLEDWLARRDRDRERTGKTWLRAPLLDDAIRTLEKTMPGAAGVIDRIARLESNALDFAAWVRKEAAA